MTSPLSIDVQPDLVSVRLGGQGAPGTDILVIPGPPGPQGQAGAAGSGYTHAQSAASASWIVTHNLGIYPAVSVRVSGEQVIADVTYTSLNAVNIIFASPQTGTARLV